MSYAIAVIDIGMTNKKIAVYDQDLVQIDSLYRSFEPLLFEGLELHDLAGMEAWFIESLAALGQKHAIKALAVSSHGASFVCIGQDGKPCVPCVFYTHEPGGDFHDRFYQAMGSPEQLQTQTGSASFKSLINPAKGIMFAQERFPSQFAKTKYLLNYPQYWGFRLSGQVGLEATYVGNHSYLWDFAKNDYSSLVDKLGIRHLLASRLQKSWEKLACISAELAATTGLDPQTVVTMGMHDSSAALLPYLSKQDGKDFVLNSTGTWCVLMHPAKDFVFAKEELGKVVFFNQTALMTPLKIAIFLGGYEFGYYFKIIQQHSKKAEFKEFRQDVFERILRDRTQFVLPELIAGSGQFTQSVARVVADGTSYNPAQIESGEHLPDFFKDFETACAVLTLSLVIQTEVSLQRLGLMPGASVFTEGGFRINAAYNRVLASILPDNPCFLTDLAEASAFGAAMTARMALSGESLQTLSAQVTIDFQLVAKTSLPDYHAYKAAWLKLAEEKKE